MKRPALLLLRVCRSQYLGIKKISSENFQELVQNLDVEIAPFFTREELDELAKDSNFIQRKGKLDGSLFFDLIVFNSDKLKDQSLNDLSIALKDRHGIEIKKQSLHDRFNANALLFLKNALEKLMQTQFLHKRAYLEEFNVFNRILIKDSTCFQVDESLAEIYPGSGGAGSPASVRIQFEYDLLSGRINDLSVNAFNDQDASNSVATIEITEKGDLIIRDLAYMSLKVLDTIIIMQAFFLCRLDPKTKAYEKDDDGPYKKISFTEIRGFMQRNHLSVMEKQVYLGGEKTIQCRLIIHLMPEEEVAKRLRKARKNNKKKGRNDLSKEYIARAHLNLFITNADHFQIPTEKAWSLYRLRWQIELIFKIWKSFYEIEKVKKVKLHRFECYLYSKLIIIVLGWKIIWGIARLMYSTEGKALSFMKAFKTLSNKKLTELREVFLLKRRSLETFMQKFYEISVTNHILEKKKQKPTSIEYLLNVQHTVNNGHLI